MSANASANPFAGAFQSQAPSRPMTASPMGHASMSTNANVNPFAGALQSSPFPRPMTAPPHPQQTHTSSGAYNPFAGAFRPETPPQRPATAPGYPARPSDFQPRPSINGHYAGQQPQPTAFGGNHPSWPSSAAQGFPGHGGGAFQSPMSANGKPSRPAVDTSFASKPDYRPSSYSPSTSSASGFPANSAVSSARPGGSQYSPTTNYSAPTSPGRPSSTSQAHSASAPASPVPYTNDDLVTIVPEEEKSWRQKLSEIKEAWSSPMSSSRKNRSEGYNTGGGSSGGSSGNGAVGY